jgi:hypothetical protein
MKRQAQQRIYEDTRHMTALEKVAFYNRIGDAARQRQTELRARLNLTPTRLTLRRE